MIDLKLPDTKPMCDSCDRLAPFIISIHKEDDCNENNVYLCPVCINGLNTLLTQIVKGPDKGMIE